MADPVIRIDVFSDIACPWCFIGKRRLAAALRMPDAPKATIRWRAFQLQPELPAAGVEARPFYERKFGGARQVDAAFARVTALGTEDGIHFAFDRMLRAPNTLLAHRVIQVAQRLGPADAVVEALFSAHFERGLDIGRREVIFEILAEAQVPQDVAELAARVETGEGADEVRRDAEEVRELGIGGVPCFIADGRLAMSGAQDEETFLAFLQQAVRDAMATQPAGQA